MSNKKLTVTLVAAALMIATTVTMSLRIFIIPSAFIWVISGMVAAINILKNINDEYL